MFSWLSSDNPPWALRWRSKRTFIIATVAIGLFTDLFLYGLVVPVLPFMLKERLDIPDEDVQTYVSGLLAAYAGASVLFSIPAGWVADRTNSRQAPFLCGLTALLLATIMLAVGRSIGVLVVARILQGISAAVVWTIGLAMVLDTVGAENLGKVIGSIFSFISVGELLAPVLGGVLYDKIGYRGVFGVASAVLALDFVMRLLIIERKTAIKYDPSLDDGHSNPRDFDTRGQSVEDDSTINGDPSRPDEESALLLKSDDDDDEKYKIHGEPGRIVRALPLLYCFRNPRLPMALSLAFVQASLLSVFAATIPTEAKDLLGFSSLEAGLLFIALDIPYLILGPVAGWAVDKYGTKPAAVIGFGYLVPTLALLRIPSEAAEASSAQHTTRLFCAMLALNGIGLAIIGSPSIVEASDIVQRYDKANPGFFGANGPYAQLYGFNSVFFCSGLALGPLVAGVLRDNIGYGNMNAVFATLAGITAVLSFWFIGPRPRLFHGKGRE
ncbi:major facilitator superfamily domain-containing protein [Microdochium trichocladiopsis]|uniref:Major facilitator superfamily domain-containing protein n=1 Tax=Microdochium trichocladiopsis TaxID=1682393 RepID=A0A9P8Y4Q2_9PEZI|nr:major facilitator superfamily domain-containing protein [Microdochium trichocladiopsis]KAH7029314.1 major facilitator superfamily domain-containing protein [Microdochium trichocladiopsis]